MSRTIVWLASYPKSGNTWVRAFLAAYLDGVVDLNALPSGSLVHSRAEFDNATGVASAHLSRETIDLLRPAFHRELAEELQAPWFVKLHDAWQRNRRGEPIFPADISIGVVVIVRNPLDVAVSLAEQRAEDPTATIAYMADLEASFFDWPDRIGVQLPQHMGDWSSNVTSWLDQKDMPVLLLKYEAMLAEPDRYFSEVLRFSGIEPDPARVAVAVQASSFGALRDREAETGFGEKAPRHERFFREGRAGTWEERLSRKQIETLLHDHGQTMQRLGYDVELEGGFRSESAAAKASDGGPQ